MKTHRRRFSSAAAVLALALSLVTLGACSKAGRVTEYPSLANQGVLPLSSTNAYVGSNLFIANEAQHSPYLYNFLKSRGGPSAIEIVEPRFGSARVLMFYPRDRQVYAADIMENETSRQWIVRGPYGISRKDYRNLNSLEADKGVPVFFIRGKEERFRPEPEIEPTPVKVLEPMIPPPAPTAAPKPKSKGKKGEGVVISKKGNQPTEFHPLNSDQQAIQMSLGFAERGSNGDLIHTVKGEHETFSTIAQWYTGSANNAAELAKVNALGVNDPLALETRITVPLKLVRNFKVMAPGN